MNKEQFIKSIEDLGIENGLEKLPLLETYYDLLVEWNEKINLTAITEREEVYLKHFYDSLTLVKVVNLKEIESFCDIGTGAGFPGIVIKMFYPHIKLTLVDALNKRINFLDIVVKTLKLENVTLVHARAEEYALKNREKFDIVTARAVAPLNILLEYSLPLVKVNKYFIAMKGNEDVTQSKNSLEILKGKIVKKCEFLLPIENSQRTIIEIKKTAITPKKYPRRYAEIKKRPL